MREERVKEVRLIEYESQRANYQHEDTNDNQGATEVLADKLVLWAERSLFAVILGNCLHAFANSGILCEMLQMVSGNLFLNPSFYLFLAHNTL